MATFWNAVLFALFSFCAQLLLQFLRGGGSVRVRLTPSPSQNSVINYEIRNVGDTVAEDVHVTFSRSAEAENELWTTESGGHPRFEGLAPGEVWTSMFCVPGDGRDSEPVTATVRYKNGSLFRRLVDVDHEQWWWGMIGRLVPRIRVRHRKSFVLDPTRLSMLRINTGYPGKVELEKIGSELEKLGKQGANE